MKTGCSAIMSCLEVAEASVKDIDFLAMCSCTGYVVFRCGSRLITHMGRKKNGTESFQHRAGCVGAVPTLQRAADFVRANPGGKALLLAVEICSACYFVDHALDTVVGNAICADGAAAFLLGVQEQTGSALEITPNN